MPIARRLLPLRFRVSSPHLTLIEVDFDKAVWMTTSISQFVFVGAGSLNQRLGMMEINQDTARLFRGRKLIGE
jgi:hypothetical protein